MINDSVQSGSESLRVVMCWCCKITDKVEKNYNNWWWVKSEKLPIFHEQQKFYSKKAGALRSCGQWLSQKQLYNVNCDKC